MAITVFSDLESRVQSAINTVVDGLQSQYASDLSSVAAAGLSLYILFYGYMVIAGKIQTPIADFTWNLARMSLIMMFVTNAGGLLSSASSAITGLQEFAAHGRNVWSVLDTRANNLMLVLSNIWDQVDGIASAFTALLQVFAVVPLVLGLISIAKELIISTITLAILTAVMPIFIFCLMYGFLKQMFARFLGAIIANVLKILFITLLSDIAFDIVAYITGKSSDGDMISMALIYVIAGIICISTAALGSELAEKLAEVSIESATSGKIGESVRSAANSIKPQTSSNQQASAKTGQAVANSLNKTPQGKSVEVVSKAFKK